ncbi:MAG: hypothetical protein ACD_38C00169G0019 [uncultured bacterium]|uniref:DUF5659 domain-containing protein n=1 Tax=Candidatus Daviesbacteria bacterium GW2011_GWC2_40_12 TaxID=1618431 RepID=A0A0G0T468_9BACT|nr:MAG: hypothetical protein ACD_38C00169G0019 [uncultured bacterium]KKR15757.1 MAG: hypothetical protein UT45_C0014G0015 [Candidatus Daviesbacteria bacterium GW2011_GWA2_39_33]KKR25255.1 MAG: hypothetical protein UT54_C0005G0015 [Candidatus Daviesbacteria bacterium GW2011_GWB1_39_5]KKR41900.1 MAG: hypothetical protein UT77_C0005G0015 [Candidatus Daviesbacteria bacterium GW2011_GWC2_40_12]OGE21178.1 MAG: hypothetical protein A2778_02520 [Candidatus Daviesbacteria bacterium RIFCSPHIGHO2_01_FULL_
MSQNKTYYETQSLPLTATIICLGIPLDSVIKSPDGKSIFVFPRSIELDQILENFWKKSLVIEPNTFWEAIRFIKSRIYGGQE